MELLVVIIDHGLGKKEGVVLKNKKAATPVFVRAALSQHQGEERTTTDQKTSEINVGSSLHNSAVWVVISWRKFSHPMAKIGSQ